MATNYFFSYLQHVIQVHRMLQLNCYFENFMNDLQISVDLSYFKIFISSKVLHVS
jgi:hypothetical protein